MDSQARWKRYLKIVFLVWTLIVIGLAVYAIVERQNHTVGVAMETARTHLSRDLAFRLWGASHGGVYIPVCEHVPINPNLSHAADRNIVTPSGTQLTMVTPVQLVRLIQEQYRKLSDVYGHITSQRPLRPKHAPDEWERTALNAFEQGKEEVSAFTAIESEPFLRLMQPMVTEEGCLKCHDHQGYQVGDILGGISISLPMASTYARERKDVLVLCLSFGVLWLLGAGGIGVGYRILMSRRAQEMLTAHQLLENVQETIIATDKKNRVIHWGEGAEALYGYTKEETLGHTITSCIPPGDEDADRERMQKVIEVGKWTGEYVRQHRDGTKFWAGATLSQVTNAEGQHNGFIIIEWDITLRKQEAQRVEGLLVISHAVQEMTRPSDIERVVRTCRDEMKKIGLDTVSMAIHHRIDPERQIVDTYRVQPHGHIESIQNRKSIHLPKIWLNQETYVTDGEGLSVE